MEVRVKCEFPYVKIMSEPKESGNCITFRGINGDTFQYIDKNGETQETGMFVFNAFGEMKERIKKLKIKKGSEISVGAYMKKWYDDDEDKSKKGQRYAHYSFNVYAVDFLPARYHKSDKDEKTSQDNKSTDEQKISKQNPKQSQKVIDNTSPENIDIKDLEIMFGG